MQLSVEAVTEAARARAGLKEFGPDLSLEGLSIFVDALNREADLTELGTQIAFGRIVSFLVNRLELTDWITRHPEVLREEIRNPIFIVGMARSGTTILHDLLALDPVHRVPQTWEVTRPCPPPESATYESDPRIAEEQGRVEMALEQNPKLATMHPMGAQLPQECGVIRCNNFTSPSLRNMFRVPSYAKWVDGIDYVPVYAAERRQLQLMQWRCKRERWVLKSPQHLATLGALVREFPDAYLIQTHRDPVPAIASLTSLTATLRALVCARVDVREIARDWLDHVPVNLDRSVAWREETGFDRRRVADLPFAELMRDPVAAIERVYGQFGLAWSGALADRLRRFVAEHPSDKHGKHQYSFADTGLSLDEVRERSRRYQEYFSVPSERVR